MTFNDANFGGDQSSANVWRRWTGLVNPHHHGEDPDYRFTLANERTFLAWIRTSLALVAGGLAAIHLLPESASSTFLSLALLGMGAVAALTSYRRWALTEIAIREGVRIPQSRLPRVLAILVGVIAVVSTVLFILV